MSLGRGGEGCSGRDAAGRDAGGKGWSGRDAGSSGSSGRGAVEEDFALEGPGGRMRVEHCGGLVIPNEFNQIIKCVVAGIGERELQYALVLTFLGTLLIMARPHFPEGEIK